MCMLCITEFMHGVIPGEAEANRRIVKTFLRPVFISTVMFRSQSWHHPMQLLYTVSAQGLLL